MERNKIENITFPFQFQCLEWFQNDENEEFDENKESFEYDKLKYYMYITGCSKNGESVTLKVKNYCPEFYVKLKDAESVVAFKNKMGMYFKYNKDLSKFNVLKKDFYGYSNNKLYKFAKFVFNNTNDYKQAISAFKTKLKGKYSIYQSSIDTFIKFIHFKELKPTGWINVKTGCTIDSDTSTSQINIECDFNDITAFHDESTAPFLQASFDIETYTENGGFPDVNNINDPIIQIGTSFKRVQGIDFLLKHIITLKKSTDEKIKKLNETENTKVIVESYNTEKEVILAWAKLINRTDPDIIYHYNGDTFDWNFIYNKAKLYGASFVKVILKLLNRLNIHNSSSTECPVCCHKLKSQYNNYTQKTHHFGCNLAGCYYTSQFSSSAYGTTQYKRVMLVGRLNFDVYIYIRREFKLRYYSLKFISNKFLNNENKVDLGYKEMFEKYKNGTPEEIETIAIYCMQDTVLPQLIVDKLNILYQYICMSNVTYVPIKYLIEKGQQIKVLSQIMYLANNEDYLVPSEIVSEDSDGFEGATVFEPEKGTYFQPVTVCDFSSLYPSIIRSNNLCYITYIQDYNPNFYKDIPVLKVKINEERTHYFAQNIDGLLPKLLSELAKSRKLYKNKMATETNEFQKEIYNKMQLAYKVSMNSVYGFLGAQTLKCKAIAETVTYLGRQMIQNSKEYIEEHYPKSKVIYGDSIPGKEILVLRNKNTNEIHVKTIEELSKNKKWNDYSGFKKTGEMKEKQLDPKVERYNKEYALEDNYQVLSSKGFVDIKKIIRHYTNKNMYKVYTPNSCVEVTEDHSLFNKNGELITPKNCEINQTELLTNFISFEEIEETQDSQEWAFILALYYITGNFINETFCLESIPASLTVKTENTLNVLFKKYGITITKYLYGSFTNFYINFKNKKNKLNFEFLDKTLLLQKIVNYSNKSVIEFINVINTLFSNEKYIEIFDKKNAMYFYILYKKIGKYIQVYYTAEGSYLLKTFETNEIKQVNTVSKIINKGKILQYVYDLETESGDYNAGIGEILCKNTDSVFITFYTKSLDNLLHYQKILQSGKTLNDDEFKNYKELKSISRKEAMDIGKEAANAVTKELFKPPVSLEFEKVYDPFIILAKKRYFGGYYTNNPDKYDKRDYKGIVVAKTDTFPLAIQVYEKAMELLIDEGEKGLYEFIDYLNKILDFIKNDNPKDFEQFTIVKGLSDSYKSRSIDDKDYIITNIDSKRRKITIKGPSSLNIDELEGNFSVIIKENKYKSKNYAVVDDNVLLVELEEPITFSIKNDEYINAKRRTIANSEKVKLNGAYKLINTPHVVLARKLAQRNPLNPPKSNDKIPYVFVKLPDETETKKLYKKVEDPEYAKRHELKLDPVYYINSIKASISPIFDLVDPHLTVQVFGT